MKSNFAQKSLKTVEWVWIVISILSVETVVSQWNHDRQRAYIFVIFSGLGLFMFILRRSQRKKMVRGWKSKVNESDNLK
ncbi:MAG: Uncharacterised protein [Owenweeksia sp. TMED14]|nr:MAG: Uncharacterised protein [Owenweeksia sp. TMED14]